MIRKINDIIGELIIVDRYKGGYKCLCSCGQICTKSYNQLKNSSHPDCGCFQKKNLINKKFGNLIVISLNSIQISKHQNKSKSIYWNCKCDCGNLFIATQTLLTGRKSNAYKHCGCKLNNISNFNCYNGIISIYKSKCKIKKLKFDLTELECSSLFNSPCYYCNSLPNNQYQHRGSKFILKYSGIDRIDSNKGYNIENVVPCCSKCNLMKNNLTYDEFIEHILSIQQNCLLPYQI